ncbi:DUF2345 domain-containing protein, partial [Iodobacter sp. CM08]|uniref:DUF2345 domain-containing protein n=1 Tax=Iodobacter sp. CM08 TaxID=3085902 RepID=UPI00298226F8
QSQLESALALAQSLGETATNQLADTIETGDGDKTVKPDNSAGAKASTGHLHHHVHASKSFEAGSNTDKDGKTKSKDQAGQQKIILLHGEDGVAITSPQSQTIAAGTNLDQVAQRDSNQTSGRRWIHNVGQHISLFVAGVKDKVALKLIAAKGKIQLQAQSDDVEITADKNVKITACKEKVEIAAGDEVLFTSGGGYIRLKGGNIEIHCPGEVSIKGASHELSGGTSLPIALPRLPVFSIPDKFSQRLNVLGVIGMDSDKDSALVQMPYEVFDKSGVCIASGTTDSEGNTGHIYTSSAQKVRVLFGSGEWISFKDIKNN